MVIDTRDGLLEEAKRLINGDREEQYGNAEEAFTMVAELWTTWLKNRSPVIVKNGGLGAFDVAMMMALLKVARSAVATAPDSLVDLAGYAAIAVEMPS